MKKKLPSIVFVVMLATCGLQIVRSAVAAPVTAPVEKDAKKAELAAGIAARTQQLAQSGAVTQDELDRAKRSAQTEQANLKATEARVRAAEADSYRVSG